MPPEKTPAKLLLFLILIFTLGLSLFINLPSLLKGFLFADQATYFAITQSLAYDGDLEYSLQGQDLNRYYRIFDAGPQGIFMKKGKDGKIFFAKSFIYPLFATPFLRLFGVNGFYVFHTLLLALMLYMGYLFFSIANKPLLSLASVLTFFFASVAMVYFFWISPDFYNIFMSFAVFFLWFFIPFATKTEPFQLWYGDIRPRANLQADATRHTLTPERRHRLIIFILGSQSATRTDTDTGSARGA